MADHAKSRLLISLPAQHLDWRDAQGRLLRRYPVSTASKGAGEQNGSFCTPRGRHLIRAKIGTGAPLGAVFVRRRPTGEIWSPELAATHPQRDWILTRILWLSGRQPGFNRLGQVDTMRRYIYLHGCPDDAPMGIPGSIGCIRMRSADIAELFDGVAPYTPVDIDDFSVETGDWARLGTACRAVREEVFVREQGVPADLEHDSRDSGFFHAVARDAQGHAIATARLLPSGQIGRMAVTAEWRGYGVGRALLLTLLDEARQRGLPAATLNAQVSAQAFYAVMGFVPFGEPFVEAGLGHQAMRLELG